MSLFTVSIFDCNLNHSRSFFKILLGEFGKQFLIKTEELYYVRYQVQKRQGCR